MLLCMPRFCLRLVQNVHTYTHMHCNCTHSKRRNYIIQTIFTSHGGESKSWVMQNRCRNAGTDNMFKAAAFREHKFSTNNTRELPWIMKGQHKYACPMERRGCVLTPATCLGVDCSAPAVPRRLVWIDSFQPRRNKTSLLHILSYVFICFNFNSMSYFSQMFSNFWLYCRYFSFTLHTVETCPSQVCRKSQPGECTLNDKWHWQTKGLDHSRAPQGLTEQSRASSFPQRKRCRCLSLSLLQDPKS